MSDIFHHLKTSIPYSETPQEKALYETPERGERGSARIVFFPHTTEQVQQIAKTCYEANIPLLPQGAKTGMVGGSTPDPRGTNPPVIISTEKMQTILSLHSFDGIAHVQAGVSIAQLNEKAAESGLFFPVKVAWGAPHLGGAVATNAGGSNFLLYGGVREQVLGLKVVLPDGEVLDTLHHVKKDNTGPNLSYDFIGSEGTFGIITEVQVKLHSLPKQQKVALFAVANTTKTMALFHYFKQHHAHTMSAFEYMSGAAFAEGVRGKQNPFGNDYPAYALVELVSPIEAELYNLESAFTHALETILGEGNALVLDGVDTKPELLWQIRESITESIRHKAKETGASVVGNDISVAIEDMPAFIEKASEQIQNTCQAMGLSVVFYPFGHVGDGNVHFNFTVNTTLTPEQRTRLKQAVWEVVQHFHGSVSAEHGIGRHNLAALALKSPVETRLLYGKKKFYDPKGLMNPGVMFRDDREKR